MKNFKVKIAGLICLVLVSSIFVYPVRQYPVACHRVIPNFANTGYNPPCEFSNGIYPNFAFARRIRGLDSTPRVKWTKELFLERLKVVAARLETTSSGVFKNDPEGSNIYAAFSRHKVGWRYESWADAVKAAGLEHKTVARLVTEEILTGYTEEELEWIKEYRKGLYYWDREEIIEHRPQQIAFYVRELAVCVARERGGDFVDLIELLEDSSVFRTVKVPCLGNNTLRYLLGYFGSSSSVLQYLKDRGLIEEINTKVRERLSQSD